MNLAGGEKRRERLGNRVVGCGITGQGRLGVVQEVPLFQRKSRRQLAGEEKVRERNAAGLRQGAKSRTSDILRKLCQSPSSILKR